MPLLTLYIHYPWCVKKCPYCDFNSHERSNNTGYIEALLADLDNDLDYIQGRNIHAIFIGGGTPSLMSVNELSALFIGLKSRLNLNSEIEITLETNPSSFEIEKFENFKNIGINRLSIGVQSFNDEHLYSLGRIHNANEAIFACTEAARIFDNFNIDLMYGVQNQTLEQCLSGVNQAIKLNPSHISFYQLTIEPNTYFAKFPPILPKADHIWQMGERSAALLECNGFRHYEVSAFGKTPSKHNLNYWQFGDYIGIGAGAHGKITHPNGQRIVRTRKVKSPKDYLCSPGKKITKIENLGFDFMLNALRLKQGFAMSLFEQTTGRNIKSISTQLNKAQDLGLLEITTNHVRPSDKGYNFLNDLQQIFL